MSAIPRIHRTLCTSLGTMTEFERPPKYVSYGTAGFRDKAAVLDTILYRVGLVAALRSRFLNGQTVGVMITASHNPPEDNGAKLVDPYGDMLEQSWEPRVADVANAQSAAECERKLAALYEELAVSPTASANVVYGKDTRASGARLTAALVAGLDASGARGEDAGLVTTPQLHYLVRATNTLGGPSNNPQHLESYGMPTQDGYYRKLATALKAVFTPARIVGLAPATVVVDCANGVGALKLREMGPVVEQLVDLQIVNGDTEHPDRLNAQCGADFVKTNQKLPANVNPADDQLYASFDGDADRVVFYYTTKGQFHLLDGDKIATLAAGSLKHLTEQAGTHLNIGVVQTAYANGSSTEYIEKDLQVPAVCTPTGVKHLHHAARKFDIGVYFEANGHGTVLFDEKTTRHLRQLDVHNDAQKRAIDTLLALSDLINQTVGDAIADLLMVLAILVVEHMSPEAWDQQYTDLPNRLLKAEVKDRTVFRTTNAERQLEAPAGLQADIDRLVSRVPRGRSFVRASGTEDVVRIYAEAGTQDAADKLAGDVKALIVDQYGE